MGYGMYYGITQLKKLIPIKKIDSNTLIITIYK